jgi:mannose-1-phosphate guanylyltransferase
VDAILLVGGQGTRLRPLTARRHKSLVPVCNRPAIEYLFDWLTRSGFRRAILALGLANEDVAARYPLGRHGALEVLPVIETHRLESGGAIRNAVQAASITERFLVLNGDIYLDFDFAPALAAHRQARAELTLALHQADDPSAFGVAVCDDAGFVTRFVEKPPPGQVPSRLVNAGAWIFERSLVDEIPPGAVRVEETLFPSLVAQRRRVLGYRFEGPWADLGTPARYLALHHTLLGPSNAVHPTVAIDPTAAVSGSAIGSHCSIAPAARVADSVLWERVALGPGAVVRATIIANDSTIGAGATLDGCVVGAGATIGPGAVLPPGTIVDTGASYHGSHAR